MCSKVNMGKRRIVFWPALIAVVVLVGESGTIRGQMQVGRSRGLDANRQVGSGGRNPGGARGVPGSLANRIMSGNVGAGKSFQGQGAIRDFRSFQGSLGTSSLSNFQRDSYGLSNNASNMGMPQSFFLPSSTVLGIRGITSGRARPGSNMPRNVNLTPRAPSGPVLGQSGVLSKFAGARPADQRLDLRPVSRGLRPIGQQPAVDTASNLFGIRRITPELGLDRSYEEVMKDVLAEKRRAKQRLTPPPAVQKFQALPVWAQPGVGKIAQDQTEAGPLQPGTISKTTEADTAIERNLAKSRELIEESSGKSGLPSLVDIYEQMIAERELQERAGMAPSKKGLGLDSPFELKPGEDASSARQRLLDKILVYNSFVSKRGDSFDEYMARGEGMLQRGNYYQAARAYEGAIGLRATNPLGYLGRAFSLAGAGELVSASQSLGRALAIFPEQAQTKIDLKGFFPSQAEIDRISEKLKMLSELKEADARIRLLLGYIYHYSGKSDLAGPVLQEAAELAKTDPSVSPELAKIIAKFAEAVSKQAKPGPSPSFEWPSGLGIDLMPGLE